MIPAGPVARHRDHSQAATTALKQGGFVIGGRIVYDVVIRRYLHSPRVSVAILTARCQSDMEAVTVGRLFARYQP